MAAENATVSTSIPHFTSEYAALKYRIKEEGLLIKKPQYAMVKLTLLFIVLALCISVLLFVKIFWIQALVAIPMALLTTQFGLLGHEAGHRQVFNSTKNNDILGLITGNLLVGMSIDWWMARHNQHHSHPNQHGMDPDVFIPVIAFSPEDLEGKGKFLLSFLRYQAYFFFPLLTFASLSMQIESVVYLSQNKTRHRVIESLLILVHHLAYLGLLFYCLPVWQALVFIVLHQLLSGVYMGSIFAPNHKGMPILDKDTKLDFIHHQVLTARNVYAHPVVDFWYGGLNYQIEHHLFPSMPLHQLRKTQEITREFCKEHNISYYETNMWQSYRETLTALHEVTAPLRVRASVSGGA